MGRIEDYVRFHMQLFGMFKAPHFRGPPLCRGVSKSVWRLVCNRERYIGSRRNSDPD